MPNATMRHFVFIINPKSGTNRVKAIGDLIEKHLSSPEISYEIQKTERAKHGTELARTAAHDGAWAVVAVGGDGSVNDVAAGLHGSGCRLGIVPMGSGNGLARTLGIPVNPEAAIRKLNEANTQWIDVGFCNDDMFLSNAGAGFDAEVASAFAKSKRRGLPAYSWLTTKLLWLFKSETYTIEIDGKAITRKAFMVNVANGRQFGYNFEIAPEASWTDGLLDVIVIRPFPKLFALSLVIRGWRGSILRSPYVEHFRGRKVTISGTKLHELQTDGDLHSCGGAMDCSVVERGLEVIV